MSFVKQSVTQRTMGWDDPSYPSVGLSYPSKVSRTKKVKFPSCSIYDPSKHTLSKQRRFDVVTTLY